MHKLVMKFVKDFSNFKSMNKFGLVFLPCNMLPDLILFFLWDDILLELTEDITDNWLLLDVLFISLILNVIFFRLFQCLIGELFSEDKNLVEP